MYEKLFINYNLSKCVLVEGEETRQESVYKGLEIVKTDKVMIHEV